MQVGKVFDIGIGYANVGNHATENQMCVFRRNYVSMIFRLT